MRRDVQIILLFLMITNYVFAQDTIRLSLYRSGPYASFKILNPKDSLLIKTGYNNETFDSPRFELLKNIPDNEYIIYVNDTIMRRGFFKSHEKVGIWKEYRNGYKITESNYKKGKIQEKRRFYPNKTLKANNRIHAINDGINLKTFYPSGSIEKTAKTNGQRNFIRNQFYENGSIKIREYFIEGSHRRVERFNSEGKITSIREDNHPYVKFWDSKFNFKDGVYDSICNIRYDNGKFELHYTNGKLTYWSFLNRKNELIVDEHLIKYSSISLQNSLLNAKSIKEVDINFDGLLDKMIFPKDSSGANQSFLIFLYNLHTKKYDYSKELSGSSLGDGPELNSDDKTVTYSGSSGAGIYGFYKIYFNKFGQIKYNERVWNEELDEYVNRDGIYYRKYSFNYEKTQDKVILNYISETKELQNSGLESISNPFFEWVNSMKK